MVNSKTNRKTLGVGLLACFAISPALAHHSGAMFDDQKVVEIKGTVKEFQYTNPHSWILIDKKNDDGSVTTWGFEAEGPSSLLRVGIRKSDFSPGTDVTIWAHPMRDGRPAGQWLRAVRTNDGQEFSTRPMGPPAPTATSATEK